MSSKQPPFSLREEPRLGDFHSTQSSGGKRGRRTQKRLSNFTRRSVQKWNLSRLPTRVRSVNPENSRCAFDGWDASTDGKARSGLYPLWPKRPTIRGLIFSRPFVTATDVEIGSVGGNVRSSRASSETSPRERTSVSSIPKPKARSLAPTHPPRPATPSRVRARPPSAAAKSQTRPLGHRSGSA